MLRETFGFYLDGLNWRTGRWQVDRGPFGWQTVHEIDTAKGNVALYASRAGSRIVMADGQPAKKADRWWAHAEHVGSLALWDGVAFTVAGQTSGWWAPSTNTGVSPSVRLGGEAVASIADRAEAGDLTVCSPRYFVIPISWGIIYGIRLVIDAQETVEGDLRVGVAAVGPVLTIEAPDWGRSMEHIADGTILTTHRDGTHSSRVQGPVRREATIMWPGGVDTSTVSGVLTAHPDYVSVAYANTLGAPNELPGLLSGILSEHQGAHLPLLYLPSIPLGDPELEDGGVEALTARDLMLWCRITSSVALEGFQGEEDANEWIRVSQLTLSEET